MTKPDNLSKVQSLARNNNLSLIAIDEAHLCTEWAELRKAYKELGKLRYDFPDIPIMALTATAEPDIVDDMKALLRRPHVAQSSVNRPNIFLSVEELPSAKSEPPAMQFARRAADIIGSSSAIIYTDFISDVGPIVSALAELGVDAVGYHGGT